MPIPDHALDEVDLPLGLCRTNSSPNRVHYAAWIDSSSGRLEGVWDNLRWNARMSPGYIQTRWGFSTETCKRRVTT
ncbi:unnamed protein product [Victoria cruziana]